MQFKQAELHDKLQEKAIWDDPQQASLINKQLSEVSKKLEHMDQVQQLLVGSQEFLDIFNNDCDTSDAAMINQDLSEAEAMLADLEFKRMFNQPMDASYAYLDIQAGSGGTEAQDWAEMLLRMYLRWGEQHNISTDLIEVSAGDVAGIKSATIKYMGEYAYGWLRTETGVHRLVRKSPFDSGNRRHTSFAGVFVAPEIDDSIAIEINPKDLKIDTYRASGAGGQHVNRTDSAVRITHLPTNTVVQCQNDRSQHKNKAQAMKQLQAKLYELELTKKMADQQELEQNKSDIGWGNQIRSYVLDQARIKDLRTGIETGNTVAVLDGDLDKFLIESLKANI